MPEYRHVRCPGCSQTNRISISERNFGRKVEIACSKCGFKMRTTIPYPAGIPRQESEHPDGASDINDRLAPLMAEFGETLKDVITGALGILEDNPLLGEVIKKIQRAGYNPFFVLTATIGCFERKGGPVNSEAHKPTSLVQEDGEIVPGTFTSEDEEILKKDFNINFGGE